MPGVTEEYDAPDTQPDSGDAPYQFPSRDDLFEKDQYCNSCHPQQIHHPGNE